MDSGVKTFVSIFILCFILMGIVNNMNGCNISSRWMGTALVINMEKGQKLVNASWKENSLWVLSRPMKSTEEAEVIQYKEYSNMGILEGKVIIRESK